jgi:endothelin-converting enzyme/putative endopeptidase
LQPYLDQVAALRSHRDLPRVLARLHLALADPGLFFAFSSGQDFAGSSQVIAFAVAGGLGLPDRDAYLKTDARSKEVRAKYVAHVANTFRLLGETPDQARRDAARVMATETRLEGVAVARRQARPAQAVPQGRRQGGRR